MAISSWPGATSLSLSQAEAVAARDAAKCQECIARIRAGHEGCPELAEQHGRTSLLCFPDATPAGVAVIITVSGVDQKPGTVKGALARVQELERLAPDAAWLARAGAQRGGHGPMHSYGS